MVVVVNRVHITTNLAARQGNFELVRWLLLNGAEASLSLKNRMGCTPIDIARICGPHHEVGGLIGSSICVSSVDSQSTTRQRGPSDGLALRVARSGQTAGSLQYDMWVMPIAELLKLSELRPHQELRAAGKLVRWNASMRGVFFMSHQWTAFTRPDHSTAQLRTAQRLLTRMLQGNLPTTSPTFVDAIRFSSNVTVTSREWKELAPHAFVWMDYISVREAPQRAKFYVISNDDSLAFAQVPQVGTYTELSADSAGQVSDLMKAVNSIPAYVEKSSHFFTLCPAVTHHELPDTICDFGSWLGRGWCRVEQFALLLARHSRIPAIIVRGGDVSPFMIR